MTVAKRLRTLLVKFDNELPPWEINAFRGAVIEKVGRDHVLFHHHAGENRYLYQYPLIQYKSIRNRPTILCLGDGVDEIHKLFMKKDWSLNLKGTKYNLSIDRLNLNTVTLNVWERPFTYKIFTWLALNEKNYPAFKSITAPEERIAFLERVLTANILSFAKGVDWRIEKKVEVRIRDLSRERPVNYKEVGLHAFDTEFTSNVFIPDYVGLGKGASHGMGMIRTIKNTEPHDASTRTYLPGGAAS